MPRFRKRNIANILIFTGALLFVLYLNLSSGPGSRSSNSSKTFAWSTIRYKTTSTHLPTTRGICPGLQHSSKPALVMSRVASDGDDQWLAALADKYILCIYRADDATAADANAGAGALPTLPLPANRGHEAMGYLTFLIDNYADLPAAGAVFVHGSRYAWHNDAPNYDNAALLRALNLSAALAAPGYHNLRCDWSASTCDPSYSPPPGSFETAFNAYFTPWDARARSDAAFFPALSSLFGGARALLALEDDTSTSTSTSSSNRLRPDRKDIVRAQCCAQFVVARENLWRHSRDEYVAIRQWLLDSVGDPGNRDAAPTDDRVAGRILSYLWHILFLPPTSTTTTTTTTTTGGEVGGVELGALNRMACPRAEECYCRLYGRCNLEGCAGPGRCAGQYVIPPYFTLPEDWAERQRIRESTSQQIPVV